MPVMHDICDRADASAPAAGRSRVAETIALAHRSLLASPASNFAPVANLSAVSEAALQPPSDRPQIVSGWVLGPQACNTDWRAQDFDRIWRAACRDTKRLLQQIAHASEAGKTGRARALELRFLRSRAAKLVAIIQANAKLHASRRLHVLRGRTAWKNSRPDCLPEKMLRDRQHVLDLAHSLNVFLPCDEPIRVTWEAKRSGKSHRTLMSFGLENRARQNLVCAILRPYAKAKADPRQFAVFGARDTAFTKAMDHVAEGFRYWLELDIRNCFPSIDPRYPEEACNSFTRLPLPAAVITSTVQLEENADLQTDNDRRYDHATGLYVNTTKLLIDARCGLPQGSPVSALVQEWFVADVLALVPDTEGARIVSYADNFLIVARTKADAEAMAQTLKDALGRLSAGRMSFDTKQKQPRHVRHGVEFLGYNLRHRNGTFTIALKAGKMDTFRTKAYALMRRFDRKRTRAKWLDLRRYVTGFRRAYAHWTTPGELHDAVLWTLLTRFRFGKLARTLADLVTDASPNGKRFPGLAACPRSKMLKMPRPSTRFRAYLA